MNNQFHTQRLREEEEYQLTAEDEQAIKDMVTAAVDAIMSGYIGLDDVKKIIHDLKPDENVDEESATGAGEAYLPGLDVPEKKYKAGYTEEKDVEPKYAAGKANNYAAKKWGWKEAPSVPNRPSKGGFIYKQLFENIIFENYSKFKNETKVRTKPEQYHQAVKAINKKLNEVNKLLKFTETLKTELSEGDTPLEMRHHTKLTMEKIKDQVVEAYRKLKNIK